MTQLSKALDIIKDGGFDTGDDIEGRTVSVFGAGEYSCCESANYYHNVRCMDNARFEMRKGKNLSDYRLKLRELYPYVQPQHEYSYRDMLRWIIDGSEASVRLHQQLNELLRCLDALEKHVEMQIQVWRREHAREDCAKTLYLTIPEFVVASSAPDTAKYDVGVLSEVVDGAIRYLNAFNINALLKRPVVQKITPLAPFKPPAVDLNVKFKVGKCSTIRECSDELHRLRAIESDLCVYVREMEKYAADVIDKINVLCEQCKKMRGAKIWQDVRGGVEYSSADRQEYRNISKNIEYTFLDLNEFLRDVYSVNINKPGLDSLIIPLDISATSGEEYITKMRDLLTESAKSNISHGSESIENSLESFLIFNRKGNIPLNIYQLSSNDKVWEDLNMIGNEQEKENKSLEIKRIRNIVSIYWYQLFKDANAENSQTKQGYLKNFMSEARARFVSGDEPGSIRQKEEFFNNNYNDLLPYLYVKRGVLENLTSNFVYTLLIYPRIGTDMEHIEYIYLDGSLKHDSNLDWFVSQIKSKYTKKYKRGQKWIVEPIPQMAVKITNIRPRQQPIIIESATAPQRATILPAPAMPTKEPTVSAVPAVEPTVEPTESAVQSAASAASKLPETSSMIPDIEEPEFPITPIALQLLKILKSKHLQEDNVLTKIKYLILWRLRERPLLWPEAPLDDLSKLHGKFDSAANDKLDALLNSYLDKRRVPVSFAHGNTLIRFLHALYRGFSPLLTMGDLQHTHEVYAAANL